jgi:hypothetical protein
MRRICFYSASEDNPQWFFQKHWKCTNWVAPKRDNKVVPENRSIRGFFDNKFIFQNWFWNHTSTSDSSQIWKFLRPRSFSLPFLNSLDNFTSRIRFLNSLISLFRAWDQSNTWERHWKDSRHSLFYRFETNQTY